MEYPKFKVCVECFTFNQSKYITDTMNGFTMQKTDFPFVCCIVDDASTDGEQDVIMDYMKTNFDLSEGSISYQKETDYAHITYARHKTNSNCFFAVLLLKENHYSQHKSKEPYLTEWEDGVPYKAFCEGDDYWIDSDKLQKQFDFLEFHPDYILVHSNFSVVNAKGKLIENNGSAKYQISEGEVYEDLFRGCWVKTLTVMYRKNPQIVFPQLPDGCFAGDIFIFFVLSRYGKFHYMEEETGTYRTLTNSAAHYTDESRRFAFVNGLKKLDYFMVELYGASPKVVAELNHRWAIIDFKHSLYASDYAFYRRLDLSSVGQNESRLALACRLCRCKPLFYLISAAVRVRIVFVRHLTQS
jgi:glycosyltransferase involved in cell wall biosynthesis